MPKKRPKLVALSEHIAVARRIIEELTATLEAEGVLRTYASSLMQAHERKMREEAKAKKGETLKKKKLPGDPSR
jgi:non-homologous end joining protein Ku